MPATPVVPLESARRLLLGAQGLLDDPDRRATPAETQKVVERLGFVQLDSINVVERAHHLTLAARLSGYGAAHLSRMLERDRTLFENWTHDASAIPTRWYAHWKPRFASAAVRIRRNSWWRERMGADGEAMLEHVRQRIRSDGPLQSGDFEHAGPHESSGWWSWKPHKAALEFLWRTGELAVVRRVNFQKVYDLTERVFPEQHAAPAPDLETHVDWLCRSALERLAVATPIEIAGYWGAIDQQTARAWCESKSGAGEVLPVRVAGHGGASSAAFALPDWERRLNRLPEPPTQARLLCPFDPVLRDRKRALRLFGFHYRFEAFVPEAKRLHGYYVMPILAGDSLVGRVDPKFDRERGALVISRAWFEPGTAKPLHRRWLEEAAHRLGSWLGATRVQLPRARR